MKKGEIKIGDRTFEFINIKINKPRILKKFFENIYTDHAKNWINKIETAQAQIKINKKQDTDNLNENERGQKSLDITHRDLLVRWLAQIDDKGSDSYSSFKNIKTNKTKRKENLIKKFENIPANWLISEKAIEQIRKITEGSTPFIEYEHNPPVKKICDIIDTNNTKTILDIMIENNYCVMIITKDEHKILHKPRPDTNFKENGNFHDRIKAMTADGNPPKFFRLNKSDDSSNKTLKLQRTD